MIGVGVSLTQSAGPVETVPEGSATAFASSAIGAASQAMAATFTGAYTGTAASAIGAPTQAAAGTVTDVAADEAATLLVEAGYASAPTSPRRAAMKALITALMATEAVSGGGVSLWANADRLMVYRCAEEQGSLVNWKAPGTGNSSKVGTGGTFVTDVGWDDPTSGNYVRTNFIPSTDGVRFTRNSNSFIASTSVDANNVASAVLAGNTQFSIEPRSNGATLITRNASTGTDSYGANSGTGLYGICRSNGSDYIQYKGATALATVTRTSSALAATEVYIGSTAAAAFSTKPTGLLYMGGYIDAAGMTALNTAWNAYVAAL